MTKRKPQTFCSECGVALTRANKYGTCSAHTRCSERYRQAACARSTKWANANPDARRDRDMRKKYGLSIEDVRALIDLQDGGCAICKEPFAGYGKHTHVDHCHKTGKVRGILCDHCNYGLGHFRDSTERLGEAIAYLQRNV